MLSYIINLLLFCRYMLCTIKILPWHLVRNMWFRRGSQSINYIYKNLNVHKYSQSIGDKESYSSYSIRNEQRQILLGCCVFKLYYICNILRPFSHFLSIRFALNRKFGLIPMQKWIPQLLVFIEDNHSMKCQTATESYFTSFIA